jgi:large subunit ribosomal protein L24
VAKMNIRKGDKVKVLTGKDKGKEAAVLGAFPAQQRVVVEKVNVVKKSQRPTQTNTQGGIMSIEAPIHVSNVALVCPSCKQTTRISVQRDEAGKKVRYCKKCGKAIDKK